MRRSSLWILGLFIPCSLIWACGSDDTPAAAGAAGAANGNCVGLYASMTPATFTAAVTASLACGDTSDVNLTCANDVTTDVGTCGVQCYSAHSGDNAAIASCTTDCVNGMLPAPLSTACSKCYTDDVICTAMNCATMGCLTDPGGTQCINCRVQAGCAPTFYGCSGLPVPAVPGGTAGAGGTGGTGGTGGGGSGGTGG